MHTHAPGDLVKNAFKYSNEKNQDRRRALAPFPGLHFLAPRALNGRHFGEIIGGKFDLASQATQRDRGGKDHRNSGGYTVFEHTCTV